jgi:2-keto-4-pentenoate hydratase/2-oxohepta-3-ene-1,7-dioic acid hydratase in catechol pathway
MTDYALVSFATGCEARPGLVLDDVVYDLAAASGHPADTSMLSLLRDWSAAQERIQSVIDQASTGRIPGQALDTLKILAPLPVPGTLFCAGANYSDHVAEMATVANIEPDPDPHTLGLGSWHFIKSSHSVIGPGGGIEIPSGSLKLDWEVELAVVIGQKTRNIAVDRALTCVAGYTVANDLSARDLSRRDGIAPHSPFRFDWLAHKSFDTACPLGPRIVPATQIADPQSLDISLLVNGEMKQNSNTSRMIFTIAEQIADLSRRLTLWPGDVILTGTPAGVGSATGQFLKSGDQVAARVAGIGELNNVVL